jgi:hypothetical protein
VPRYTLRLHLRKQLAGSSPARPPDTRCAGTAARGGRQGIKTKSRSRGGRGRGRVSRLVFVFGVFESVRAKQTHCGLKFRFVPAATTCAKASRQLVGDHIYMKHVAPHEISGPKSARPHGGIPSPGAEQRRGQWVVPGQGFT